VARVKTVTPVSVPSVESVPSVPSEIKPEKRNKTMHKHKTPAKKTAKKMPAKKNVPDVPAKYSSRKEHLIALASSKGISRDKVMELTGWKPKSVRGFFSTLKTLQDVNVQTSIGKDGVTVYHVKGGK
jgi:hypothetical protein